DLASDAGPVGVLVLGLAALALVVVLTLPQVRWLFRPLIQPRWTWFLRDRESVRAASGTGDDRSDSLSPAGARSGQARPDR
ncbi:MAG: hypothetical protein KJ041_11550, partial [Gammaproteobacteria bacterium]|nr:hypothetical protein [Gammaproteobacteria bacterium]